MKKSAFCLALLSMFFLGQVTQGQNVSTERYHLTAAEDIGISNLLFIKGNWASVDPAVDFTETWVESKDSFFCIRRDGSNPEKPFVLFAFTHGMRGSHHVYMQCVGPKLEVNKEAVPGVWDCQITNKCTISFGDEKAQYDSPTEETLNIEIEKTEQGITSKKTIHLKRLP